MIIKKFMPIAKRLRNWLGAIAVFVALYSLAGFWLLPEMLRYQLPEAIRDATGRNSRVAAVAFHPYDWTLKLSDFELQEKNGQPFFKCAELYVDFNMWRSLQQRFVSFAEVRLVKPFIHVERAQNGAFNFDDLLLSEPSQQPAEREMLPFEIDLLQIRDGVFDWLDRSSPDAPSEIVKPINLELKGLTSRKQSESKLDVSLALSGGSSLQWSGTLMLEPLASVGHIHIRELQAHRLWEWFLRGNRFIVLSKGAHEIDTQYSFAYSREQLNFKLAPLQINVKSLAITEANEKGPFIDLQALQLRDAEFQLFWLPALGQWQIKMPQGQLQMEKFALANPRSQKLHMAADDVTLQGLGFEMLLKDTLQLKVSHQKLGVKNSSFSLDKQRPLKITAAAIDLGPAQFAAQQAAPKTALKLNATQNGLTLQKLSMSLPAQRDTVLDVASVSFGKAQFALQPRENATPQMTVAQDKFSAKRLSLREAGQAEPLTSIATVMVNGMQFDLDKKLLKIATAVSDGADAKAWLESGGKLNYQTLFSTARQVKAQLLDNPDMAESGSEIPQPVKQQTAAPQWTIAADKLELKNATLNFQDRSRQPPTAFKLSAINTTIEDANTASGSKIPLRFSALFNDSGKIDINGSAVVRPFNGAFDVKVEQFPLKPFQPYVSRFARLDILSGTTYVDGKLALDMTQANQPQVSFNGAAGIDRFHSRDQLRHRDFAKWERFALKDAVFALQPRRFEAGEVHVEQPYLRVAIGKNRTLNFADILVKQQSQNTPSKAQPAQLKQQRKPREAAGNSPAMAFDFKKIKVHQGRSDFSDFSLTIPFAAFIDHLDGALTGLSSQRDAEASLLLQGSVLDMAPVEVDGQFQPYQGKSKVSLSFHNLPLPVTTPYMAEFAGYKIEKGQMSLDLNYEIDNGRLQANNKMLIDQLVLGEKVASPRAVSLPIELAIALLKDSQSKINLDFPITGSLEDPKFSIGGLIADALQNVVYKVVTSPFRTIAALIGRKDGDMGYIEFKPGSAALKESEKAKLDGLAKVLGERKSLKLDIKGAAYQQQDWPELTGDALRKKLEDIRIKELHKKGEAVGEDDIELSADEYKRLLADLFIENFPQLAKRSLFGTPKLINDGKSDFYRVAEQKLREQMPPNPRRLNALAAERGRVIAKYLIQQKGIERSRIFILDSKVDPKTPEKGVITEMYLRAS